MKENNEEEFNSYTPPVKRPAILIVMMIASILLTVWVFWAPDNKSQEGLDRADHTENSEIPHFYYDMHVKLYFTNNTQEIMQIFVYGQDPEYGLENGNFYYNKDMFRSGGVVTKKETIASYVIKYKVLRSDKKSVSSSELNSFSPRKYEYSELSNNHY